MPRKLDETANDLDGQIEKVDLRKKVVLRQDDDD